MYYICKFSESWFIYDSKKDNSRPLQQNEISALYQLFPTLLNGNGKILIAIQIAEINPAKLAKGKQDEYFICRFDELWLVYDTNRSYSRSLQKQEIITMEGLFSTLFSPSVKILETMQITSIQPNKLASLTGKEKIIKSDSELATSNNPAIEK